MISRKYNYEETMQLLGMVDIATLFGAFLTISVNIARKENFLEWLIPATFVFIIPLNLGLLIYWLKCKGTKLENKELKDLLDSFFEDSEVYLYLKNKYSKVERKDKITNE